ncbi:CD209 antigen-like protein E [Notothenia coriiceps]|uniref:CD209 antigen-like protein E n=1 Tax=Notothenia coriiceps TaxID=8208 RepID=A0A6I9P778_9TELE|nr:PREDICTED: CD209 antigen-like protein E [Notothenia coriiceps]
MARFIHREESEITMDYVNLPEPTAGSNALESGSGEDAGLTPAVSGRTLRLVAVSFGLLCILQVALNISLHFTLYSKTSDIDVSCTNLTYETEKLKKELINFDHFFQQGWVYIRPSFYYISSVRKTWQESRADCLQRGADLVIINSKAEQDFITKFNRFTWIGLTDVKTEDTWKWVDGTPLNKSYWGPGEPNSFEGNVENCVEIRFFDLENSWNDIQCGDQNFWICEKMLAI